MNIGTTTLDASMSRDHSKAYFAVSHLEIPRAHRRPHCVAYVVYNEGMRRDKPHVGCVGETQGALAVLKAILHFNENAASGATLEVVTNEGHIHSTLCGPEPWLKKWMDAGGRNSKGDVPPGFTDYVEVGRLIDSGRITSLRKYASDDVLETDELHNAKAEAKRWRLDGASMGIWDYEGEVWDDDLTTRGLVRDLVA